MNSKTLQEQVAFDMRKDELLKVVSECPDEFREELMDTLKAEFCPHCWQPYPSREVCHCWNDE